VESRDQSNKPAANPDVENNTTSSLDESEIEKQHQYQMFPTPDEEFASEVITELDD
jgi:hypothetical protein